MAHRELRVAIVGGGIGGLTLAIALRARGMGATVFERAGELREVGAGVALAANATRLLERLGIGDDLARVSVLPSELVFRDGHDGRRLVAHPIGLDDAYRNRFGAPYYGIQRGDLQQILARACGFESIRPNHQVTGLRMGVETLVLKFKDSPDFEADVVVGADGVHSVIRPWITAEQPPVYTGTSCFRGMAKLADVPDLPDASALQFWTGDGAHVLHYPVGGDRVNFLAVLEGPAAWPPGAGTKSAPAGELLDCFAGWHPGVRQLLASVPQSVRWGLLSQPPMRRWSRDRAVLIGDAAHAMLPHQGQGANQAVEDAVVLADALAGTTRDDCRGALRQYVRTRRARTRAIQRSSLLANAQLHLRDGPAAQARDEALKRFPDDFGWIHAHDVLLADEEC